MAINTDPERIRQMQDQEVLRALADPVAFGECLKLEASNPILGILKSLPSGSKITIEIGYQPPSPDDLERLRMRDRQSFAEAAYLHRSKADS